MASPSGRGGNFIPTVRKFTIPNDFSDNYKEIIENFKESFEVVHQLFGLSQTLKIHIIVDHYSDYFEMTGTNPLNPLSQGMSSVLGLPQKIS